MPVRRRDAGRTGRSAFHDDDLMSERVQSAKVVGQERQSVQHDHAERDLGKSVDHESSSPRRARSRRFSSDSMGFSVRYAL